MLYLLRSRRLHIVMCAYIVVGKIIVKLYPAEVFARHIKVRPFSPDLRYMPKTAPGDPDRFSPD